RDEQGEAEEDEGGVTHSELLAGRLFAVLAALDEAALARALGEDQHLVEAREVHRRRDLGLLVEAELAPHDPRHAADEDRRREALAEARGVDEVADADVVLAAQVLDVREVAVVLAGAAEHPAGARALDDHVDGARAIDGEQHVAVATPGAAHLPDQALRRDHGHAGPHVVALAAVEAHASHAEEARDVAPDDLRADELAA